MTFSSEALLVAITALPFVGSCVAMLFRANARNAEAYLAGLVAVLGLGMAIATYPRVVGGRGLKYEVPWIPELGVLGAQSFSEWTISRPPFRSLIYSA